MTVKLTRSRYVILLESDGEETMETVEVRAVDQMDAETLAARNGIGDLKRNPISHTIVWLYCAATRTGKYAGPFQEFRAALCTFAEESMEEVPPTVEPSGSGSPLHFTTETPATG